MKMTSVRITVTWGGSHPSIRVGRRIEMVYIVKAFLIFPVDVFQLPVALGRTGVDELEFFVLLWL